MRCGAARLLGSVGRSPFASFLSPGFVSGGLEGTRSVVGLPAAGAGGWRAGAVGGGVAKPYRGRRGRLLRAYGALSAWQARAGKAVASSRWWRVLARGRGVSHDGAFAAWLGRFYCWPAVCGWRRVMRRLSLAGVDF